MSIETAFERVSDKIEESYDAVGEKGGTIPSVKKIANLPTAIRTIPTNTGSAITKLQEKTVTPTKSQQVVVADSSFDALSKVTVEAIPDEFSGVPNLQAKTVSPSDVTLTVRPDNTYDGLSQVTVNAAPLQSKSVTPSTTVQNVTPDSDKYGLSQVSVGKIPEVYKDTSDATASASDILEGKTAYINGQKVTGTATGTSGAAKLQAKTVIPTAFDQTVKPDSSYDGLSQVTVTAVPEEPVNTEYRWWSPNMSSNTIPAPYKLFGDSLTNTSYKILDNNATTIEALTPPTSAATSIPELGFDFGIPVKITGIKVSAKTASDVSNNIKVIKILGNNNGPDNDFTLVKEQDVSTIMTNTKEVTITFNPAAYRYFKILFTEREVLSDRKVYVGDVTFYREFVVANVNLQSKTVTPSTSAQTVKPDETYDGLSQVTVNAVSLQAKTVTPTAAKQTVSPDSGSLGLSSVTVNAAPLEEKTVTPSTSSQSITPTSGKIGMSKVTVNAAPLQTKTVTPSASAQNVTPDSGQYGLSKVTVNAAPVEEKTVTPSTSAQNVTPSSGKVGMSKVTVNAIPSAYKNTSDATVAAGDILSGKVAYTSTGKVTGTMASNTLATPTITVSNAGLVTASVTQAAGYTAGGTKNATKQITAKAAETFTPGTANKTIAANQYLTGVQTIKGDSNLTAANIKSGVSIFGVTGTHAGTTIKNQSKTVDPNTYSITVTPDSGYTGLSQVTVNKFRYGRHIMKLCFHDQASCDIMKKLTVSYLEVEDDGTMTWRFRYFTGQTAYPALQPMTYIVCKAAYWNPIWIGPYPGGTDPVGSSLDFTLYSPGGAITSDSGMTFFCRDGVRYTLAAKDGELIKTGKPDGANFRKHCVPFIMMGYPTNGSYMTEDSATEMLITGTDIGAYRPPDWSVYTKHSGSN